MGENEKDSELRHGGGTEDTEKDGRGESRQERVSFAGGEGTERGLRSPLEVLSAGGLRWKIAFAPVGRGDTVLA